MPSNSLTEPAPPARRPLWRTLLVRGVFGLAVLFTLYVGFVLVERARGRSAWKAYQAEARARQVKLGLAEFVPPPIPEERNFAAIPLFQNCFSDSASPDPLRLPERPGGKLPPFGGIGKGQLCDLDGWRKYFIDHQFLTEAGDSAAGDVLKALDHYAAEWEQLRVAAARPECRFPVRYEDGLMTGLPHMKIFQSAARLNLLRMASHLAQRDSPTAYEDFQMGLRLYTALTKEPFLIVGLVRLNMLSMLLDGVWGGLAQRQWAAPELEKIAADLARLRLLEDYALTLGSERGSVNMMYDGLTQNGTGKLRAETGTIDLATLITVFHDGQPHPYTRALRTLLSPYPSGWLLLSQTRTNRYFDEMLARVTQDPPRIHPERSVPSWPANMRDVGVIEHARYMLFLLTAPALEGIERSHGYSQTMADEARIACALEQHRLAHGALPETLDALVPAFLPSLPRDVMTGATLHYRRQDDGGYVLYSVAWNLQDDGGRKSETESSPRNQPDWVWSVPGK